MSRILVADDHGLYRKGLRSVLKAAFEKAEIAEANSLDTALIQIEADGKLDLVSIDLNMPGFLSFDSLRAARERHPETRFLVITASDNKADVLNCLAAGLHGFVSKLQTDDEIVGAVKYVMSGCIYVPPWLSQIGALGSARCLGPGFRSSLDVQERLARLTARQRDVLPLLARGLSNKEIARALSISEATTKIHAAGLCRALGVRNRTEAAVAARALIEQNGRGGFSSAVTEGVC